MPVPSQEQATWLKNAQDELSRGRYNEAAVWLNMIPNGSAYEDVRNSLLGQVAGQQGVTVQANIDQPFTSALTELDNVRATQKPLMEDYEKSTLSQVLGGLANRGLGTSVIRGGAGTKNVSNATRDLGQWKTGILSGYDDMERQLKERRLGDELGYYDFYDQMLNLKKQYDSAKPGAMDYIGAGVNTVKSFIPGL